MFDPEQITDYDRTVPELQEFLVFAIMVAGKRADLTVKKMELLKEEMRVKRSWFTRFKSKKQVNAALEATKVGQYNRIGAAFAALGKKVVDLRYCSAEDLEEIPGIGPKTARFFLLHSRPNERCAVLDTHILKSLRERGYDAPLSTPSGSSYKKWEAVWLSHVPEGQEAEKDLATWTAKRMKSGKPLLPKGGRDAR